MLNDREIEELRFRSQAHARSPEHQDLFRGHPGQLQLAQDWIAVTGERKQNGGYQDAVYAVRPTGGGKTISIIDHMIGVNRDPRGRKSDKPKMLWDKRCLFLAPTNVLVRQWAGEMGVEAYREAGKPNLFEHVIPQQVADKNTGAMVPLVGVFDAAKAKEHREAALKRHIVGMTYDSFRIAVENGDLDPADFSMIYFDEVHSRPRGPFTRTLLRDRVMDRADPLTPEEQAKEERGQEETMAFIRRAIVEGGQDKRYGKALVYGVTATDLFKSNRTIGDYLFGENTQPFHRTTLHEAMDAGELCKGYRNIIAYPQYNLEDASFKGDGDVGADLRRSVLEQEACDDAMLRILEHGRAPKSGKRYRDMKSAAICKDIAHAERQAKRINTKFGEGFAKVVSGESKDLKETLEAYRLQTPGAPKMLLCAQILLMGWDDSDVELLFMDRSRFHSPTEMMQGPGRALRKSKKFPDKEAQIVNFMPIAKGESVTPNAGLVFGHLAEGYYYPAKPYEYPDSYPPREGGEGGEFTWPDKFEGLVVHYTTKQLEYEQHRYNEARARDEDAKKLLGMMTPEEMAREIKVDAAALQRYVFDRLETEYDRRQTRQKEIVLRKDTTNPDEIQLHTQRFPVASMGHYRVGKQAVFCLSKAACDAARRTLHGNPTEKKPDYAYSMNQALDILNQGGGTRDGLHTVSDGELKAVADAMREAYYRRGNYQHAVDIRHYIAPNGEDGPIPGGVRLEINQDFGFTVGGKQTTMWVSSEGLEKLFELTCARDLTIANRKDTASEWRIMHPQNIVGVKSPYWLNKEEAMKSLKLHANHKDYKAFDKTWKRLEKAARRDLNARVTTGYDAVINMEGEDVFCGFKREHIAPGSGKPQFCIQESSLDWIARQMTANDLPGFGGSERGGLGR